MSARPRRSRLDRPRLRPGPPLHPTLAALDRAGLEKLLAEHPTAAEAARHLRVSRAQLYRARVAAGLPVHAPPRSGRPVLARAILDSRDEMVMLLTRGGRRSGWRTPAQIAAVLAERHTPCAPRTVLAALKRHELLDADGNARVRSGWLAAAVRNAQQRATGAS